MTIKKKQTSKTIFVVFFILAGVAAILYFGVIPMEELSISGHFEAPYFCYIECAPAEGSPSIETELVDPTNTNDWIKCPSNSEECNIQITYPDLGMWADARRVEYYICDDVNGDYKNCKSEQYYKSKLKRGADREELPIPLSENKVMHIEFQKYEIFKWVQEGKKDGKVNMRYIPFILWSDCSPEGGRNPISTTEAEFKDVGCKLVDIKIKQGGIISSELSSQEITRGIYNPNKNELKTYETFNYFAGTITRANEGNIIKAPNGEDGYCALNVQGIDAVIWGFSKVTTGKGTYKMVDRGKILAQSPDIECCKEGRVVGNSVCENFKWKAIEVDSDTGDTNIPCTPIIDPCNSGRFALNIDDQTTYIWKCINNYCVISDIRVEKCVVHEDCPDNKICVDWNCEEAGEIPGYKGEDENDNGNGGLSKCADCSAFSKSYLLGEVFPDLKCEKNTARGQGLFGCLTSILKLFAVPLIFIFVFAFGSKKLKPIFKDKNMQWISIVLSLVIASVIAFFVYTMFTVGIIIAAIFIILSILITIFFPGVTMAVAGAGSTAGAIGGAVRGIKGRKKE